MDDLYISKVCNGDTDAFRYFIQTYQDMAFTVAMSVVKDEFAAQDVVQQAFIKTYHSLGSYSQASQFKTWFYRIVVNESLQWLRNNKKDKLVFAEEYDGEIADESVIDALAEAERKYMMNEAMKQLPSNESLALRLYYLEEESIKNVCEITGWSESNAKVILHRARKNMYILLTAMISKK